MGAYDLTNKKFGNLTAKRIAKKDNTGHNYWECYCECGEKLVVRATELINGSVTMCKNCKRDFRKKVVLKTTSDTTTTDTTLTNNDLNMYDKEYENIFEVTNTSILNAPIIFNVVHAINSDLTYSAVTKRKDGTYIDSLAGEYDKFFKIRERLDELSVCHWNVGEVIYTSPVYSLLTKKDKDDIVTYEAVEKCLVNLKKLAMEYETFYLAFPKICCGKDGLDWSQVKLLIKKVFGDSEFELILFE